MIERVAYFLVFSLLGACSAVAEWDASYSHLGDMNVDGTLRKKITLGQIQIGYFAENISLEHVLHTMLAGGARSGWAVPELESCVIERGDGLWAQIPGGREAIYSVNSIPGAEFQVPKGGGFPKLRNRSDGVELVTESETSYLYRSGSLAEIRVPGGEVYSVESTGSRILSISASSGATILRANYSRLGVIDSLQIGRELMRFHYASNGALLLAMTDSNGRVLAQFEYDSGLITKLTFYGVVETYDWRPNPWHEEVGLRRYRSPPFVISRVGNTRYDFSQERVNNRTILIRERTKGAPERVFIDWLTKEVTWEDAE